MWDRWVKAADGAVLALAAWVLASQALLWSARVPYPYDLEWMEGGMLAHAWRVQRGLPLYVPPSPEWTPFLYPPLYTWIVAALGSLVGLTPALGRLVSIGGTLAAVGALAFGVRRLGGPWPVALGSAAVFLGLWPYVGSFFDLVRPDGLCMGFLAWALVLGLERGPRAAALSGALVFLAFLTKHNAAGFGLPLLLVFGVRDGWRCGGVFAAASLGPAVAAMVALQVASGGHFLRYLLEVPAAHPSVWTRVYPLAFRELGTPLPFVFGSLAGFVLWRAGEAWTGAARGATLVAAVAAGTLFGTIGTYVPPDPSDLLVLNNPSGIAMFSFGATVVAGGSWAWAGLRAGRRPRWEAVYAVGVGSVAFVLAAWMRAHNGGFLNVHLHLFFALALAFGALLTWAWRALPGARLGVLALLALQLGWELSRMRFERYRPTPEDRAAGDAFVEAARQIEGPVLSPFAAWLPVYAGKEPSLHYMGLWDLEYPESPYQAERASVRRAVAEHRWGAVFAGDTKFPYGIAEAYGQPEVVVKDGPALMPKTGWRTRPTRILRPK